MCTGKKNHYYINGAPKPIICHSDHRALINIENKDLSEIQNNRELILLESITPYLIKVEHKKSSNDSFADTLSRLPSKTEPSPGYIEHYTKVKLRP